MRLIVAVCAVILPAVAAKRAFCTISHRGEPGRAQAPARMRSSALPSTCSRQTWLIDRRASLKL
jgi:hypothetical protein